MSSRKQRRLRRDREDARKQSKSAHRRHRRREQAVFEASTTAVLQHSELHKEKHFPAIVDQIFRGHPVALSSCHPLYPLLDLSTTKRFARVLCKRIAETIPQFFGTPCHNSTWTYAHALRALFLYDSFALRDPADWYPKTRSAHRNFDALLQFLFVKYPTHPSLRSYLLHPAPESTLTRCFFQVAQGASLHKIDLPIPLTKKMCHLFHQAPPKLGLIEAFRWAQLKALGADNELFGAISRSFLGYMLMPDEDFWLTVLTWFAGHWDGPIEQVGPALDYIRTMREQHDTFSMKGRTAQALLRQMHDWHRELGGVFNIRWKALPASGLSAFEAEGSDGKLWEIREVRDSVALFREGRQMRHCVYSYLHPALSGRLSIWSMTYSQEHGPKQALTIEVRHYSRTIVQVRGKSNRRAREEEQAIIRRWAQQNQLGENYL